nr:hypothetical protein [Tanacetum cinerariifolium]
MTKDPSIPRRNKVNWNYVRDDQMFTTIKLISIHQNTQQFDPILRIELKNEDSRNSTAYKEYYAIASGAAPPKTKASVKKTQSSFDTTITPPMVASTRLLTSAKGKQPAKSSKAKGTGIIPGVPDVPTDESDEEISWKSSDEDDDDEDDDNDDDDQDTDNNGDDFVHPKLSMHEEEAKDDESFDPTIQTPKNSVDEGNDNAILGMNVGIEEGQDAEDDDEELYRDVNINLEGRDAQMTDVHTTQEFEETHVILTPVNPDGQQHSSSMSSQFVTSMLNPSPDAGIDSLFELTPRVDVQASTITSYAVAADLSEMELKKILIEKMESNKSIHRSDEQRNLYKALADAYECDKIILDTYEDTVTLKRRHDDADKDEEPSAGLDRRSKRIREGKEPESTSAIKEKASKTTGKSTEGSKSHQKNAS